MKGDYIHSMNKEANQVHGGGVGWGGGDLLLCLVTHFFNILYGHSYVHATIT